MVHQDRVAATMLNPALVSAILANAAGGYSRDTKEEMPWPLSFIIAPLVLHRSTRENLPRTIRTHLTTWVSDHPTLRAGFPLRAYSLVEPVRAGLRYDLRYGILRPTAGKLQGSIRAPRAFTPSGELDEMLKKSLFVGRWLSRSEATATVFAVLGVKP